MELLGKCIIFIVVTKLCSMLIVRRGDTYDTVPNTTRELCKDYKGTYDITTGDCQCRGRPTFMSGYGRQKSHSEKCKKYTQQCQLRPNSTIHQSSCRINKILVWNVNSSRASWLNMTIRLMDHLSINTSNYLQFVNLPAQALEGQLMRIKLKCGRDLVCRLLKMRGERSYPIEPVIFRMGSTSREHATTYATVTPNVASTQHINVTPQGNTHYFTSSTPQNGTNSFATPAARTTALVIIPVVVISAALFLAVCTAAYLARHRLRKCLLDNAGEEVIYMNESHVTLQKTLSPVYASVIAPSSHPDGNDSNIPREPDNEVYYSKVRTPPGQSESSNSYSALHDFSSSPYSALSVTDNDATLRCKGDSFYAKPGEITFVNRSYDCEESLQPEYHEVLPDSTEPTTELDRTEEAEPEYFEVESERIK